MAKKMNNTRVAKKKILSVALPKNGYQRYQPKPARDALSMTLQKQYDEDKIQKAYNNNQVFYAKYLESLFEKKWHNAPENIRREIQNVKLQRDYDMILHKITSSDGRDRRLDDQLVLENPKNMTRQVELQAEKKVRDHIDQTAPKIEVEMLKPSIVSQRHKIETDNVQQPEFDQKEYDKMFTEKISPPSRFIPNADDLKSALKKLAKVQKSQESQEAPDGSDKISKKKKNYHPLGLDMNVLKEAKSKLKEYNANHVESFDDLFKEAPTPKEPKTPRRVDTIPEAPPLPLQGQGFKHKKHVHFASEASSRQRGTGEASSRQRGTSGFRLVDRASLRKGRGLPRKRRLSFGDQFELSEPDLREKDTLILRYKKNHQSIRDLPAKKLTPLAKQLIETMLYLKEQGAPGAFDIVENPVLQHIVSQMSEADTEDAMSLFARSGIFRDKEYKVLKMLKNKKDRELLERYLSAMDVGNDSPIIQEKITELVYDLKKKNVINTKQANTILLEMHKITQE